MKKNRLIFILESIHQVLHAEKVLHTAGLDFDIIPVPKEINPECGMALEVDPKEKDQINAALIQARIKIKALYYRSGQTFEEIPADLPS